MTATEQQQIINTWRIVEGSAKAMSVGMPQTYQLTSMGYFLTIEENLRLIVKD